MSSEFKSSVAGLLNDDTKERPRRCSPVAYLYWRDTLDRRCPDCGGNEILYWLDMSPGLYCPGHDCYWDWVEGEGGPDELAFMDDDYDNTLEEEIERLFNA